MGIIWLECLAGLLIALDFPPSWIAIYSVFFSFTVPIVFWFSIRTRFIESFRVPVLEKSLNRFKKNDDVFQNLMANQPVVETGKFENETRFGDAEAPIEITLVSNPKCGPCAHAYKTLEAFPELFKNKVSIKHRFMVRPLKNGSSSYQMLSHLFSLKLSGQESDFRAALSSWFSVSGEADVEKWRKAFPLNEEADQTKVQEAINQHYQLCREAGITATPAIFINNKKLPQEFSIQDLIFQIRRMIKKQPF
jgi:glutaredoxin